MMNLAAPAVASAAFRGLYVAVGGLTLTVSAPVIAIAVGIPVLAGLAFYTLSHTSSSVRLTYANAEAEFRRDS